MRVTTDTNVILRILIRDDLRQTQLAARLFDEATLVAISPVTMCEVAWLLKGTYKLSAERIATFFRMLMDTHKVELDRSATEAGLAVLEAGGDFADGVIAHQGSWLGGETFVSFDKAAVKLLSDRGLPATLLR